jgi:carbon monoxide dehydrogenase subunit G
MGQTNQSTTIAVPPEVVWGAIRNFHDMSWSPNVITSLEVVGEVGGDQKGAGRILNGAFHETLIEVNDADRRVRYSIDDGPSPISKTDVSNYVGELQLSPDGDGTLVEWSSSWDRNDEPAFEFCHGIYVALLADMKASLESA